MCKSNFSIFLLLSFFSVLLTFTNPHHNSQARMMLKTQLTVLFSIVTKGAVVHMFNSSNHGNYLKMSAINTGTFDAASQLSVISGISISNGFFTHLCCLTILFKPQAEILKYRQYEDRVCNCLYRILLFSQIN